MQNYKVKLATLLEDGNKLEFEAHLEADSYQQASAFAEEQFKAAILSVSQQDSISIDKVKLETSTMGHHH